MSPPFAFWITAFIVCSFMWSPSAWQIIRSRLLIIAAVGLLKSNSTVWLRSDLSFCEYLSLQMQMIGTLDDLIVRMRSATPPRSPPAMPSTSSMMRQCLFLGTPAPLDEVKLMALLVDISRIMLESLPPTPLPTLLSDLERVSDALTSIGSYPHSRAMMIAAEVFPIPGDPERRTAFLFSSALPRFLISSPWLE